MVWHIHEFSSITFTQQHLLVYMCVNKPSDLKPDLFDKKQKQKHIRKQNISLLPIHTSHSANIMNYSHTLCLSRLTILKKQTIHLCCRGLPCSVAVIFLMLAVYNFFLLVISASIGDIHAICSIAAVRLYIKVNWVDFSNSKFVWIWIKGHANF